MVKKTKVVLVGMLVLMLASLLYMLIYYFVVVLSPSNVVLDDIKSNLTQPSLLREANLISAEYTSDNPIGINPVAATFRLSAAGAKALLASPPYKDCTRSCSPAWEGPEAGYIDGWYCADKSDGPDAREKSRKICIDLTTNKVEYSLQLP